MGRVGKASSSTVYIRPMRRVLKIPQARFPAPELKLGRSFAWSVVLHVVILVLLVWRVQADHEQAAGAENVRCRAAAVVVAVENLHLWPFRLCRMRRADRLKRSKWNPCPRWFPFFSQGPGNRSG